MKSVLLAMTLGMALLQSPANPSLRVSVKEYGSLKPLAGAEVVLAATATNPRLTAFSDSEGYAVFPNLPPGPYTINTQLEGYLTVESSSALGMTLSITDSAGGGFQIVIPATAPPVGEIRIQVNQNQSLTDKLLVFQQAFQQQMYVVSREIPVTVSLCRPSTITGQVHDSNGAPVAGNIVTANSIEYQRGRAVLVPIAPVKIPNNGITDSRGNYRLTVPQAGAFIVREDPPRTAEKPGRASGTYYPNVTHPSDAKWIRIESGEEKRDIDITVPDVKTFTISGMVINPPDKPIDSIAVVSTDTLESNISSVVPNLMKKTNREFQIAGIPPGSWELIPIVSNPQTGTDHLLGRAYIEVTDRDLDNVAIRFGAVDIRGRVVMNGAGEDKSVPPYVSISLVPKDNLPSRLAADQGAFYPVDSNGEFTIPNVPPGKFGFQVQALDYAVTGIREGPVDIFDTDTLLVGGEAPLPIEIELSDEEISGQVVGSVSGIDPTAPSGDSKSVRVVLAPQFERRENLPLYRLTVSHDDGSFGFWQVPPGAYRVFAFKNLPDGAGQSAEFLSSYESNSTSVVITADPTDLGQIPLITVGQ